jgi:hypothetical protein
MNETANLKLFSEETEIEKVTELQENQIAMKRMKVNKLTELRELEQEYRAIQDCIKLINEQEN